MDINELKQMVNDIYDSLERNNFSTLSKPDNPLFDRPLVGVAAGNDPYYDFLKKHIGPFHWSPSEIFQLKYPGPVSGENLRVVSIVFPQTMETKKAQSKEKNCPAREWIVSRGEWEPLMKEFSGKLVKKAGRHGNPLCFHRSAAGFSTERSETLDSHPMVHRHSAYLAGLGTFGLSEGLITERGKAVRITPVNC